MLLLLHFVGIALVFLLAWFAGHYLDKGLSSLFPSQLISRLNLPYTSENEVQCKQLN